MKTKLISNQKEKTFVLVLDIDDEAIKSITEFAIQNTLSASHITAIGAFKKATLAYFNWETKEYQKIFVDEQVEVLSFIGDISLSDGKPKLHVHVVLGKADGTTVGGHLVEGVVRPTLEVVLAESPVHLQRKYNPEVGLALIDLKE